MVSSPTFYLLCSYTGINYFAYQIELELSAFSGFESAFLISQTYSVVLVFSFFLLLIVDAVLVGPTISTERSAPSITVLSFQNMDTNRRRGKISISITCNYICRALTRITFPYCLECSQCSDKLVLA